MLKKRGSEGGEELTSGKTLLYAAEASQSYSDLSDCDEAAYPMFPGAATAILTNPIWVVKIRMFTTHPNDPTAYRGTWRESFPPISATWSRGCIRQLMICLPHRWVIEHPPNRGSERSLSRDSLSSGWCEQRCTTVYGVRTDQGVGL